jgi:hypothetical protein
MLSSEWPNRIIIINKLNELCNLINIIIRSIVCKMFVEWLISWMWKTPTKFIAYLHRYSFTQGSFNRFFFVTILINIMLYFIFVRIIQLLITIFFQIFILRDVEKLAGCLRVAIIYIGSGVIGNLGSAIFLPYQAEVIWLIILNNDFE